MMVMVNVYVKCVNINTRTAVTSYFHMFSYFKPCCRSLIVYLFPPSYRKRFIYLHDIMH